MTPSATSHATSADKKIPRNIKLALRHLQNRRDTLLDKKILLETDIAQLDRAISELKG